ncbi:putative an aldehyde reductase [Klebsiella pneumoniae subsp. rhinoscleromatis]|nr:putative an aldehyde reductase [Klebsiella pneumoniae subsp. rhinoscleromatis]
MGLTVIDTAEMYADGGAEEVVGQAIRGLRDRVVLVSKVYPWHAGKAAMHRACENSLRRLQTDYLDMYLLHWRGDIPLQETVEAMEKLVAERQESAAGASLIWTPRICRRCGGRRMASTVQPTRCSTISHRGGIEYDLLPWCPAAQSAGDGPTARWRRRGAYAMDFFSIAISLIWLNARGITVAQLLLAWVIRHPGVLAIPKAASIEHVVQNAAALDIALSGGRARAAWTASIRRRSEKPGWIWF